MCGKSYSRSNHQKNEKFFVFPIKISQFEHCSISIPLLEFIFHLFQQIRTGIPCSYSTRCYSISITASRIHTKRTYDTIRSMRPSILQRATRIKPEASKWKRFAATVQFHRSRCVIIPFLPMKPSSEYIAVSSKLI